MITDDTVIIDPSSNVTLDGVVFDLQYILKYAEVLRVDYITINDWTPVADGVDRDIGIVLKIKRGDILLAYTPSLGDSPDDAEQHTYPSGNIFITTENQIIWIKPYNPNFPVSMTGEIVYNVATELAPPGPSPTWTLELRLWPS
jgi:hypothetical protein